MLVRVSWVSSVLIALQWAIKLKDNIDVSSHVEAKKTSQNLTHTILEELLGFKSVKNFKDRKQELWI